MLTIHSARSIVSSCRRKAPVIEANSFEQITTADIAGFISGQVKSRGLAPKTANRYRDAQRKKHTPGTWVIYFSLAALPLFGLGQTLIPAADSDRRQASFWFLATYVAYAAALCLSALAAFPVVDRWQNLAALAQRIHGDSAPDALALLAPDETTIAMLDRGLRTRFTILTTDSDTGQQVVSNWFNTHGLRARVLVLLPGHAPGELTRLLERVHHTPSPGDGIAGTLAAQGAASIVRRYELPQGRRYALLGPPTI